MKTRIKILGLFVFFFTTTSALAEPLNVLLWDHYFDPPMTDGPSDTSMGAWGEEFAWDPSYSYPYNGKASVGYHGLIMSYALRKDLPEVVVHRAHDEFIPWQDPEFCLVARDMEFNRELKKFNYKELPNCRRKAEKRIAEFSQFLRKNNIKLVNMSHGIYFDNYNKNNPILIHKAYPELDMDVIYRFLYKNFLSVGEIFEKIFADNPEILFVVAAGNNANEVDRELFLKFSYKEKFPVPTVFASFASKYDNVIAVAATNDGTRLDLTSNFGKKSVDIAKMVGGMQAPNGRGGMTVVNQTSGATAETTRLYEMAMLKYKDKLSLTPQFIKYLSRKMVTPVEKFKNTIYSGGYLDNQVFMDELERLWQQELARYGSTPAWTEKLPAKNILPAKEIAGSAEEFHVLSETEAPKLESCEQVRVDAQDRAWMSYPWRNMIVRLDPVSGERKDYVLDPRPDPKMSAVTGPDGINIGPDGKVWYGEYQVGALGMIDPATDFVSRFPAGNVVAIVGVGANGHVWGTSHQAKTIFEFDPVKGEYIKSWKTRQEWPRDVRADRFGSAWITAGGGQKAVLVRLDSETGLVFEYPIPTSTAVGAMWLEQDPTERYVYVTTEREGFYVFDKLTKRFWNFQRQDTVNQNYLPIAVAGDGRIAIGNTAGVKASYVSVDVLDPQSPEQILSYRVPTQAGKLKEGLDFDSQGRVWYCQTYTNIVGRLNL